MACMRRSSRCCRSDSLGCLPRNFPLARTPGTNLDSWSTFRTPSVSSSCAVTRAHTMLTLTPADLSLSTEICTRPRSPLELHCLQMVRAPPQVRCREISRLGSGVPVRRFPLLLLRSPLRVHRVAWRQGERSLGAAFKGASGGCPTVNDEGYYHAWDNPKYDLMSIYVLSGFCLAPSVIWG